MTRIGIDIIGGRAGTGLTARIKRVSRAAWVATWLVGFGLATSSCFTTDFVEHVPCTKQADCLTMLGTLFPPDGGDPALLPQCCGSFCLLPAGGCEFGYRDLTANPPGYGNCVSEANAMMCPPAMPPDLSVPRDMSTPTGAGPG
jgi:hypothetical protein